MDSLSERCKKQRYEKTKLLELRKNQKCQEWPKVLNKRFIGVDGKWDPVGAFENNSYPQRVQSRDDIDHCYSDRYRKRQREDYKYYYYGDGSKRYSSSYGTHYPNYYQTNSKEKYQYEDDVFYDSSRNRVSPSEYYPPYSYQSSKSRSTNAKDVTETVNTDSKPEWFTGGPNNINETIELSGMSRELEAGIIKNRKSNKRNDDNFQSSKRLSPQEDSNPTYSSISKDENNDLDSHLMKIIKNNVKEKDKRKSISTAKEVEKVLKSILLRPNEDSQEVSSLAQNSIGVVRTVNEIEADLKLKGNRGAGDMSAYYKLLGLVQNGSDNHIVSQETSTNNNHPRPLTNTNYSSKTEKSIPSPEINFSPKMETNVILENSQNELKDDHLKFEDSIESEKANIINSEILLSKVDEVNPVDIKKVNGFNNYNNAYSASNALRNERIAMTSRNMCNPLSSQFSGHLLGNSQMGQNAYRWIRAMNNAAAASARMTQINQQEYCTSPENNNANWDIKSENKQETENGAQNPEANSMDVFNQSFDNNARASMEQTNGAHMNNYLNSLNMNNYMNPGSSLFNQLSMKQFLPFGYHSQTSMFGRQLLNPYLLQQLFVQKQWENRNFSLQNQLRQYQSMNFNSQQNVNNAVNAANFTPASTLPLDQSDCSAVNVSK